MSKIAPRRKRGHYSGQLAQPIACERPLSCMNKAECIEYLGNLLLLCEQFGIATNPMQPGWSRDLALCLARRHESLFAPGSKRRYSEIFNAYGINPDHESDPDLELALRIAVKHVPGFSLSQPERAQSRLQTAELASLTLAAETIRQSLQQAGKKVSDRNVAAVLMDPRQLASIVLGPEAQTIVQIIKTRGNDDRGNPRPLSYTALRCYLRQIRHACRDYRSGAPTSLQIQFVEEVFPVLDSLSKRQNEEVGQI